LRFPEFTEEWNYESLDTIAPNITSGRSKPSLGEYNLYGSTGIIGKTATADYSGDMLLVARVGANAGSLQLVNDSCGITDNTLIIKPCKLSSHYLYFYLQHYNLNRLVFGSGQPLITAGMLKKVRIPFGNQLEQKKIENFLCCIDERITTQNKIIEKYESLIKGIIEKTFVSTQYVPLQHYSPIITSGKDKDERGNYPLYGSTGVIGSVSKPSYNKSIVLIARVGSIGNVQYVTTPCGISDNTLIIDAGEENRFIYYYLNGYNFSHIISGTTQPLITASSVKKIKIPVIEKHRRKKIVSTLCAIERKLYNERQITYLLSRQKDFLLSQMFI
jgi:type I restriction enzyme S subunit